MGTNVKKQKLYTIKSDELDNIISVAVEAGIKAYKKEESKSKDKVINRNLYNTRKLLESYRTLKNDLQSSDYGTDEGQNELRFKCVEDLMQPGETSMDDVMAGEIERLQKNAYRKRQIERALDLMKEDCNRPGEPEAMRRYRVIMMMYIDDEELTTQDIADAEFVTERTIQRDVRTACKMLTPYLFSIDAIIN